MEFAVAFPRGGSSSTVSRSNQNLEVLIFVEGGKPENPEKNPRSRDENQQQTQPTCDAGSGNRTRATAVGGGCSPHCAIPVSLYFYILPYSANSTHCNYKNYNFLTSVVISLKKLLFCTNSLAKLLSDSLLSDSSIRQSIEKRRYL